MEEPRKRGPGCRCCAAGCAGMIALLAAFLGGLFLSRGTYRPHVPPPPPLPSPNGLDDYMAAGEMYRARGGDEPIYLVESYQEQLRRRGQGSMPRMMSGGAPSMGLEPTLKAPPWNTVLEAQRFVVAQNRDTLARLRAGLPKACRVPAARHASDRFPYLSRCRALSRLLCTESDVRAARGDHAGAFDSGLDAVELGQDVMRGGPVIHGLVGITCQAMGQSRMTRQIDRLTAAECDRLAARYERLLASHVPLSNILREERYAMMSSLPEYLDGAYFGILALQEYSYQCLDMAEDPCPEKEKGFDLRRSIQGFRGRSLWRWNRDDALRQIERQYIALDREACKPAPNRIPVLPPTNPVARELAPEFDPLFRNYDTNEARNRLLVCALRIRAYRLRHGRLPAALADAGLSPDVRTDPFNDRPFVYRPQGGDYLLYSVGPDRTDDGGVPLLEDDPLYGPGDIGMARLRPVYPTPPGAKGAVFRRVPHMKPPKLPPGAALLQE